MTGEGSGLAQGHTIVAGGSLVLGQDQDNVGGGFVARQAFVGDISHVNLIGELRTDSEIAAIYNLGCQSVAESNADVQWADFLAGAQGNAEVLIPSSCE